MSEVNVSVNIDLSFREIQSIKLAHYLVKKLRTIDVTNKEIDLEQLLDELRLYAIDLDFIEPVVFNTKKDLKALEGFL